MRVMTETGPFASGVCPEVPHDAASLYAALHCTIIDNKLHLVLPISSEDALTYSDRLARLVTITSSPVEAVAYEGDDLVGSLCRLQIC